MLDRTAQEYHGLDHPRADELVAVAEPDAWFTYYYWLNDDRAPDFARGVEIHRKPGYDPAELFFDPHDPLARARAGVNLIRKKLGLRYAMRTVPLDPSCVRGTYGRRPDTPTAGPVLLCSEEVLGVAQRIVATDVRALVLALQGLPLRPAKGSDRVGHRPVIIGSKPLFSLPRSRCRRLAGGVTKVSTVNSGPAVTAGSLPTGICMIFRAWTSRENINPIAFDKWLG